MDAGTLDLLRKLPAHPGLCATCEHLRLLASRRSVFVRCGLADVDPAFARYPPLPVRACPGYRAHSHEEAERGPSGPLRE